MTEEKSPGFIHIAKEFFDAAVAWADEREKGDENDKAIQEAWDRLFELHYSRIRKIESLQVLRDAMKDNWAKERASAEANLECQGVALTQAYAAIEAYKGKPVMLHRDMEELEWFRRRQKFFEAVTEGMEYGSVSGALGLVISGMKLWDAENPKPGS